MLDDAALRTVDGSRQNAHGRLDWYERLYVEELSVEDDRW
jgi:hypothetical protein